MNKALQVYLKKKVEQCKESNYEFIVCVTALLQEKQKGRDHKWGRKCKLCDTVEMSYGKESKCNQTVSNMMDARGRETS